VKSPQRIVSRLALVLGVFGTFACVAGIVALWSAEFRLSRATEHLFGRIDVSLQIIRQHTREAAERLETARITSESISEEIKRGTRGQARQQVAQRLDLAEKVRQVATTLQQIDQRLETAQSAVELVRGVAALAGEAGAAQDSSLLAALPTDIASLRSQLAEVAGIVARIEQRASPESADAADRQPGQQATRFAVPVAATLGDVGRRVGRLDARLTAAQDGLDEWKAESFRRLRMLAIAVTALITWLAAGQIALGRLGWAGLTASSANEAK